MKKSRVAAAVASAVLIVGTFSTAGGAHAEGSVLSQRHAPVGRLVAHGNVVSFLEAQYGDDLVVVGPVEFVSSADGLMRIVGQTVSSGAIDGIAVGDYVAVLGLLHGSGKVDADEVLRLADRYVPGASPVFVRGKFAADVNSIGYARIGEQNIDLTSLMGRVEFRDLDAKRLMFGISGLQPLPGGVLLASGVHTLSKADGSLGTGRVNGSLGTGRGNGSLGTGKADGSLGTG